MFADDILVFLRVSAIMGIMPFYRSKKKQFRTFAIFPCILITITMTAMLIESYLRIFIHNNKNESIIHVFQLIVDVCMNAQMMINLNFLCLDSIKELFNTFNEIDNDFQKLHKVTVTPLKYVLCGFVVINMVFILMNFNDFWLHTYKYEYSKHILHYCGDIISSYNINTMEFLKLIIVYSILQRFRLYNIMADKMDTCDVFVGQRKVEQYIMMHRKLCDLVDYFNHIYGWNMLLSVIQTIVFILRLCTSLVNFKELEFTLLIMMWVIYYVIQLSVFAAMCEKVSDQGTQAVTLGFRALQRFNNIPVMREKLLILTQQATARCPYFTAAGFFRVDFSMLFTFVNLITTYIIVIVQFSQGSKK